MLQENYQLTFPDLDVAQLQRLTIAVLKNNRTRLNFAIWEYNKELGLGMQRRTKMKMYQSPMIKLVYTYWMFNVIRQGTRSEKVKRITGVERGNDGRYCSMAISFSALLNWLKRSLEMRGLHSEGQHYLRSRAKSKTRREGWGGRKDRNFDLWKEQMKQIFQQFDVSKATLVQKEYLDHWIGRINAIHFGCCLFEQM